MPTQSGPTPAVRLLRTLLIGVLLAETILGLIVVLTTTVISDGRREYLPRVISLGIVVGILATAGLVWHHRNRR